MMLPVEPTWVESGDALRNALRSLRYGFAIWSADGQLLYCNDAYGEIYYDIRDILVPGLAYETFLRAIADAGQVITAPSKSEWLASALQGFGHAAREEHVFADGRTFEITQDVDSVGNVVTTVADVSSARKSEAALRRAKEIAEDADQSKSRFLRAANHDLRQPLSTLRILIYNCIGEEDKEHRDYLLHAMDISVAIMEDLLNAFLQIGQLDAGKIVPKVTTFQISQLLDRLDIQFQHQAREKGLRLRILQSSATVCSDRALLERILSNLVANAIRYTDSGSVLVGCRKAGPNLRVEVRDTGRGIETAYLERIFDEFYQIPDGTKPLKRGLGLGLSIVKRLADLLENKISVRSAPGRGSTFSIEIPLGDVRQSEMGEPEINEMIGGEFSGRSVFIIEDDDQLRQVLRELLERWGMIVHTIADFEEARFLIEERHITPQLMISDYSLRGTYGTDLVKEIRECCDMDVPSIIVTADTDPGVIDRLKKQSFPVLIKPVSPPRLRVLMHNLLYEPDRRS